MVTQATGGLAAYILRISAATDASVPRAFDNLSRSARQSRSRIAELDRQQRELNQQLRRTSKGTDEYRDLERQIRETRDEARALTDSLEEQQRRMGNLGQAARRLRNVAGAAFGGLTALIGGAALGIDRMGESLARASTVAAQTAVPIETLQFYERLSRIRGFDFDPQDILEVGTRLGEIRDGAERGEAALQGTVNALERLGFDARTVSVRDVPQLLQALRGIEDLELRQFLADEIFSGTGAENFVVSYVTANEELIDSLERSGFASQAQADAIIRSREEIILARDAAKGLSREFLTALAPAVTNIAEAMGPVISGLANFVQSNQGLVGSLPAVAAAIGGLATAIWTVNAAVAAYRALQGPVGWAILGTAAGLLAAGGITAAVFINRGRQEQERRSRLEDIAARNRAELLGESVGQEAMVGTRSGAYAGVRDALAPEEAPAEPPAAAGPIVPQTPSEAAALNQLTARTTEDFIAALQAAEERAAAVEVPGFERGGIRAAQRAVDERIEFLEGVLADTGRSAEERAGARRELTLASSISSFPDIGLYDAREQLAAQVAEAFNRGAPFPNLAQQALDFEDDPAGFRPIVGPDPRNVAEGAVVPVLPPPVRESTTTTNNDNRLQSFDNRTTNDNRRNYTTFQQDAGDDNVTSAVRNEGDTFSTVAVRNEGDAFSTVVNRGDQVANDNRLQSFDNRTTNDNRTSRQDAGDDLVTTSVRNEDRVTNDNRTTNNTVNNYNSYTFNSVADPAAVATSLSYSRDRGRAYGNT